MPQIYGYIVWGGICFSLVTPVILFIIVFKRSPMRILVGIPILMISVFVCLIVGTIISFLVADKLQAVVAMPYITNGADSIT
jgi:hypothetical protein